MALKYKYAFRQVPTNATAQQFEDFLNARGQEGWQVVQVVIIGTNRFVLGIKELAS